MPLRVLFPLLLFSAFLTETKFIPTIQTNFGAFEVIASLFIVTFFLFYQSGSTPRRHHPLIQVSLAMVAVAAVSQLLIPRARWHWSLIDLAILAFLVTLLYTLYRLALKYRVDPAYALRIVALSVLVVGPWVLLEGFQQEDNIHAVGPFRNRAHMGVYMLTAFWIVLLYRLWPGLSRWERWISHASLALALYAVSVSGRRSVYLSLLIGLAGLGVSFLLAQRKRRLPMFATAGFVLAVMGVFYFAGDAVPRAEFFQERVGMIGESLEAAFSSVDEVEEDQAFVALQRRGVKLAFLHNPILGIGWGGFFRSPYSPTGHEVHSTPLRFVAELGVVGIVLYGGFMGVLLLSTVRLARRMRPTPYGPAYLVLALAFWSLSVSYLYNRHITERTFWLLVFLYFTLEIFAHGWWHRQRLRSRRPGLPGSHRPPATGRPMATAAARPAAPPRAPFGR